MIQEVCGGFEIDEKVLTVHQIANFCGGKDQKTKVKRINDLINDNIKCFIPEVDVIDLKLYDIDSASLINSKLYTQAQIGNAKSLFILSKTGYCKLHNIMRVKDEKMKNTILKKYFNIKDGIYNDTIICGEIQFKNEYEEKIKVVLENLYSSAWNIDEAKLKKMINNEVYLPIHQYIVGNTKYRIDFFFKELKIIVEFDENRHKYYINEDNARMDEIVRCLSKENGVGTEEQGLLVDEFDYIIDRNNSDYQIIRISENEKNSVEKLIGIVLGTMLNKC